MKILIRRGYDVVNEIETKLNNKEGYAKPAEQKSNSNNEIRVVINTGFNKPRVKEDNYNKNKYNNEKINNKFKEKYYRKDDNKPDNFYNKAKYFKEETKVSEEKIKDRKSVV